MSRFSPACDWTSVAAPTSVGSLPSPWVHVWDGSHLGLTNKTTTSICVQVSVVSLFVSLGIGIAEWCVTCMFTTISSQILFLRVIPTTARNSIQVSSAWPAGAGEVLLACPSVLSWLSRETESSCTGGKQREGGRRERWRLCRIGLWDYGGWKDLQWASWSPRRADRSLLYPTQCANVILQTYPEPPLTLCLYLVAWSAWQHIPLTLTCPLVAWTWIFLTNDVMCLYY